MTMQSTAAGRITAWILLGLIVAANVAGYAFDLYGAVWWFDRVLHGFTILGLTFWLAVVVFARALRGEPGHRVLTILLPASLGVALGALWEVAEWGFDQIAPGDIIKGKHDTILDVVMDTIGALAAGVLATTFLRRPR